MKSKSSLFLAMAISTVLGTAHAGDVTGSWEYAGPAQSGMWLTTKQMEGKVRFQLEIARGAPSYNSGWIEGEFELAGTVGVFRRIEGGACEISFEFARSTVRVKEAEGRQDCDFGANVYADGTLRRKSTKTPAFSPSDPRFGPK